ncbi:MAG: gamma-glutamyltransferase family protein [Actinobacteria bacterium]|nr:gamma-glutamyltransferase family protein [Actinomycetota bacterium]
MREALRFPQCAVASPHYLASAAGLALFARGGNAVDAVLGANLALGVVAPYYCGYGGDLFAIVWDGRAHGYLGSGCSPAASSIEQVREATGGDTMPWIGPHTVTVPGAVAGWFDLLGRYGSMSFGEIARDAVRLAREGFTVTAKAAEVLEGSAALYTGFPDWQAAYPSRAPGVLVRQPALAATIELLARDGPDAYYRGPIAHAVAHAVQRAGGTLHTTDLAAHCGEWVEPLRAPYRDLDVLELPPPTQGVTALEILRILDGFTLPSDGVDRHHLMIEACKLGLADRDSFVTDPAFMSVAPDALLADDWIEDRRLRIDPRRSSMPPTTVPQRGGTAYLCAADRDGLMVSLIQSNFLAFGSGVHVPEWGINLNNRGSSFTLDPDTVNALAPGKRPMHTLVPALALRDGTPALVFGTMGGDAQAQVQAQLLARIVDDREDLQRALDGPRWQVDPGRWAVQAEPTLGDEVIGGLEARGHHVRLTNPFDSRMGHAHAIRPGPGGYAAATDPRAEGAALGL